MGSREQSLWREAKGAEHPFMLNIVQLLDKIQQSHVDVLKIDCEVRVQSLQYFPMLTPLGLPPLP